MIRLVYTYDSREKYNKQTTALYCDVNRPNPNAALTERITSAYNTDNLFSCWLRVTLGGNQDPPTLSLSFQYLKPLSNILCNKQLKINHKSK